MQSHMITALIESTILHSANLPGERVIRIDLGRRCGHTTAALQLNQMDAYHLVQTVRSDAADRELRGLSTHIIFDNPRRYDPKVIQMAIQMLAPGRFVILLGESVS